MTKEEAIKILERIQDPDPHEGTLTEDAYNALQMAIDLLKIKGTDYLKRCPFCGKPACIEKTQDTILPWAVRCINTKCGARTGQWMQLDSAAEAWNKRR